MITLEAVRQRAENDAKMHGYYLNPDPDFQTPLLEGLVKNEERYGYSSCPCRLAMGKFELDRDIICPCDYRDPDCDEYGYCYCALYVRKDVFEGRNPVQPIPERRPVKIQERAYGFLSMVPSETETEKPVKVEEPPTVQLSLWYCRQCGYVCFRETPPYVCPLCKAKSEMFTAIILSTVFTTTNKT
ncbi:MAG: ferredoxin-thioredoxin reductase catalytic domain-containing protein [Candidatus Bathyarchaeota archaeon]